MSSYLLPVPPMPQAVPAALGQFPSTLTVARAWQSGELESLHKLMDSLASDHDDPFGALRDELSDYVKDRPRDLILSKKSVIENRIVQHLSLKSEKMFEALHSTVIDVGRLIHQRPDVLRKMPTNSVADLDGNKVVYCQPDDIEAHIKRIGASYLELRHRSLVLAAIYVMVAVSAVHPIRDGNGRLGRILFNMNMQADYGLPYIPLYELGQRSDGGWLLALRRAQIQNDWDCVCSYIVNAVKITADLQSVSAKCHVTIIESSQHHA